MLGPGMLGPGMLGPGMLGYVICATLGFIKLFSNEFWQGEPCIYRPGLFTGGNIFEASPQFGWYIPCIGSEGNP